MDKTIIKFDDTEIEKYKFHQHKSPFMIENIDFDIIVIPNKVSFGKRDFKHFIGYKNAKRNRLLCIFLPKMSSYRRDFNKTTCMSFLIRDEKLLEKYNEIQKNISNIIKKELK